MNTMKITVLATAVAISMGASAAQSSEFIIPIQKDVFGFNFVGNFVMFDGYDPTFSNPANVVDNGNGLAGDPVVGSMLIDPLTGTGSATLSGQPFFGSTWLATGITLQATSPGMVTANMLFHWGAVDSTTACGVTNCDIGVTVGFSITPTANPVAFSVTTVSSDMPGGPFAGFQPTFNGIATYYYPCMDGEEVFCPGVPTPDYFITNNLNPFSPPATVPVPAAAWLLGSGLLGLIAVARRKAA